MELVVSTDTSLAGVHWPEDLPLSIAADRAVCSALSDLAAMGAEPRCCWLNVMAEDARSVEQMGQGAVAALAKYDVELSGGDTTRSRCNALSVTVAGEVAQGTALLRSAAQPEDNIWISGRCGFHAAGLYQWLNNEKDGGFVDSFHVIKPLLEQGVALRRAGVRCCSDVSDGLLQDAGHIARMSGVGMEMELSLLPDWQQLEDTLGVAQAVQLAARGGEDYALLFAAPVSMRFSGCVQIGRCRYKPGITLTLHDQIVNPEASGYDHFK